MNKEYVLNRLANGESIETIGKDIADMMNAALDEYKAAEAAKRAEAEAAAKKTADAQHKRDIAEDMIALIKEYGHLVAPECDDVLENYDEDDVLAMIETMDQMFNLMVSMAEVKKLFGDNAPAIKATPVKKSAITTKKDKTDEEILADFIASLF